MLANMVAQDLLILMNARICLIKCGLTTVKAITAITLTEKIPTHVLMLEIKVIK